MHSDERRIDGHVHFYTEADLARVAGPVPYALPAPHSITAYLDGLIDKGHTPKLLNNVHLSILPDSENVFASFAELAALQARDPERYGAIRLWGTIKADPDYADTARLSHPQVAGIRIVLLDAAPETVSDDAYCGAEWQALFARLRPDQHVHVYAQQAATNLKVLRQVPGHLRVIIDHLGSGYTEEGCDSPAFYDLLTEARRRGNVWFKGPGYRTSIDVDNVVPFAVRIVRDVGASRLMLEATDAPHVGLDHQQRAYAHHFTPLQTFDFCTQLAEKVAEITGVAARSLLRDAASEIFPSS